MTFLYLIMNIGKWCHRCSLDLSSCSIHLWVHLKATIFLLAKALYWPVSSTTWDLSRLPYWSFTHKMWGISIHIGGIFFQVFWSFYTPSQMRLGGIFFRILFTLYTLSQDLDSDEIFMLALKKTWSIG